MTKEEFNQKLKSLRINAKDFARIADIPYSTINNWGFKTNDKIIPVPKWVEPFLNYYEKSRKYDYLKGMVEGIITDIETKDFKLFK